MDDFGLLLRALNMGNHISHLVVHSSDGRQRLVVSRQNPVLCAAPYGSPRLCRLRAGLKGL